jgi:hypothetical protein
MHSHLTLVSRFCRRERNIRCRRLLTSFAKGVYNNHATGLGIALTTRWVTNLSNRESCTRIPTMNVGGYHMFVHLIKFPPLGIYYTKTEQSGSDSVGYCLFEISTSFSIESPGLLEFSKGSDSREETRRM